MGQKASTMDLQVWDGKLACANANYEKLYQEMLKANKESPAEKVDILWRLAKVTYLVSLNKDGEKAIKEKTQEVIVHAEKALKLDENNFQAHLWLATAAGKLARMESDLQLRLKSFGTFVKHLTICVKQNAQEPLVLFMEGSLHVTLLLLSTQEKAAIGQLVSVLNLVVPLFDSVIAETKLRKSIELNPKLLDSYLALANLLIRCKKFPEAREVIDKGLTVQRVTKSDEKIAKDLEQLKAQLPPVAPN